jgi:hypothetical protein
VITTVQKIVSTRYAVAMDGGTVAVHHGTVTMDRGTVTMDRGTVTMDRETVTTRFHGLSRTNQALHALNRRSPAVRWLRASVVVSIRSFTASLTVHGTAPQRGIAGPQYVDTPGGRVSVHPTSLHGS